MLAFVFVFAALIANAKRRGEETNDGGDGDDAGDVVDHVRRGVSGTES